MKSMFCVLMVLLFAGLGLTKAAALELTGPSWQAVEIAGSPVACDQPKRAPHLVFNPEGRVSGATGCNRFTGTYKKAGSSLSFSPLGVTKMACPPPLDDLERSFLKALAAATAIRQTGNTLELLDAAGQVVMRLQAK